MITPEQINELSKLYQTDNYVILREYLQLLFLSYLYQKKEGDKIYFKGGTAIRLLFGSSRFSEDLDFSTLYKKKQIKQIIEKLESEMQRELPELQILLLYSGKNGIRFRIKYQPPDFQYSLVMRLDFTEIKKTRKITASPLLTKFPIAIFPLISHLDGKEILAEKICALATRNKGRDFFDVWYLLERGVALDKKLIKIKFLETGVNFNESNLIKKIELYSQNQLNLDLARFLPKSQRKITGMLKEKLIEKLSLVVGNFGKSQ